jgi:glyoxylase-like metal-dependent hydrolase (beta-lactamase superfamily II)
MEHCFKDVVVVRTGDQNGNSMVLKITTNQGLGIHAVSVSREGFSYTGPTWAYLFENEGLTLIDTGVTGSFPTLAEGMACAGYQAKDIERVIITHGHEDHDGAVAQLVEETNAELWAHDIYAHLQPYDPRDLERRVTSPLQREMRRIVEAEDATREPQPGREGYLHNRRTTEVKHRIKAEEQVGTLTFMHAPGHSPDEICVTMGDVVFTGDHVLPEITPHPTTKTAYTAEVKSHLPTEYHEEDGLYGLAIYLRSLQKVADLGPSISILPAHRLYNRSRYNFLNATRGTELIQHHAERLASTVSQLENRPVGLEQLTRAIFDRGKLEGGNLRAALSEMVAHVELLEDTGDLRISDGGQMEATGSANYRQWIQELAT